MPHTVILSDIAEKAGVHKTTVSLALRNSPKIPLETRERIQNLARQMGYRPDPLWSAWAEMRAKKKRGNHGSVLGFIQHDPPSIRDHPEWRKMGVKIAYGAARARAEELGYLLDFFDTDHFPHFKLLNKTLVSRGIRGLLIPQLSVRNQISLDWSKLAVVCCGKSFQPLPFHTVKPDVTRSVWEAFDEAVRRGYRRIGLAPLTHAPRIDDDALREGAAWFKLQTPPPGVSCVPLLRSSLEDKKSFLAWFEEWRPEVVIAFTALPYHWLIEAGVSVPGDTAFINLVAQTNFILSGCHEPHQHLMETCINLLDLQIRHNLYGPPPYPQTILVNPTWHEGETLPKKSNPRPRGRS